MSKKVKFSYRISLFSRDGSGPREQVVLGDQMEVNNRGDLLILESGPAYSGGKVVAAYKSGIWSEAIRVEE